MNKHFFRQSDLSKLPVPSDLFEARFIHAENISVAFNDMKAGATVPLHTHVHETIDYVLDGEIEMTIGDQTQIMFGGMVARVPSNIPHEARAISDCRVINVFYPKRDDFMETKG